MTVRHASGTLLPNAQVVVEGTFPARPAARTDANGQVIFLLFGQTTLGPNPVTVTVTAPDGTLARQLQTAFIPPVTRDISVTVGPDAQTHYRLPPKTGEIFGGTNLRFVPQMGQEW